MSLELVSVQRAERAERPSAATAGVLAPPPVLFGGAWVAAELLHRLAPASIASGHRRARTLAASALVAAGTALSGAVVRHFAKAATPVNPLHPSTALVVDGPYRHTRNPDYIGQTLIYTGLSLAANRAWPLMLLPAVLLAIDRAVVAREERYLLRKFGRAYRDYLEKVPRWL